MEEKVQQYLLENKFYLLFAFLINYGSVIIMLIGVICVFIPKGDY